MIKYDKDKDLAEILLAGIKVKYGSEKADQVKTEFENLGKLDYRRNAEDLTAVVERFCRQPEIIDAEFTETSIDTVVQKPSLLKVVAKGTLNLVNKTCWYYPLVGALPGKYQDKIAEQLGHDSDIYSVTNMVADIITTTSLGYYLGGGFGGAGLGFLTSFFAQLGRVIVLAKDGRKYNGLGGPTLLLPLYAIVYSGIAVSKVARESFATALQQEQQKLLQAKPTQQKQAHLQENPNAGVRVVTGSEPARIEGQKPEVVDEEESEETTHWGGPR